MWQREQKLSSNDPEPDIVWVVVPMLKVVVQLALANGFSNERGVASGGFGVSQLPSVAVKREMSKKAPRQPGSRHELDIIDPFHSPQILVWQELQTPGLLAPSHSPSKGGGKNS